MPCDRVSHRSNISCTTGDIPAFMVLHCEYQDDSVNLVTENRSVHVAAEIQVTVSYFDEHDSYISFQDHDLADIAGNQQRSQGLECVIPPRASSMIVDVTAAQQTLMRRHWKKLVIVASIVWGLVIVARRLQF